MSIQSTPGAQDLPPGPGLRILSSWGKSPTRGNLFIMDYEALYREFDPACRRFVRQGYNTLYVMMHPYRSPAGAVPWEADLTPDDDDFERAGRTGEEERRREEACFAAIIETLNRHRLKAIFNAGVWAPQSWYRAHPGAVSRFPDQTVQFDKNFLADGARVFNPCFRSPEFLDHTRDSIRAWLRAASALPGFEDALCRVSFDGAGGLRLAGQGGTPLFIEHQDTHDRDWCHCRRCEGLFREYLRDLLRQGATPDSLGLEGTDPETVPFPLSPGVDAPERFAGARLPDTPAGNRLWLAASRFWSEGVAAWAGLIRSSLREFYPEAELATVSKYCVCRPLTDYPRVARGNRVFLMDSYPMESGTRWNLTRYLFDLEIYQSAAASAGQALVAHAQAYDNPRPGHVSRPPTPGEYLQQHVAGLARGLAAIVDFAMDHAVDLCSTDEPPVLLPAAEVDRVVALRQAAVTRLERVFRQTRPYDGAVLLRYHRPSLCGTGQAGPDRMDGFPGALPCRAEHLLAEYHAWKQRGVPVRVVWDDGAAEPTLPAVHEVSLQGADTADYDLSVRVGEGRYVITLINLRPEPRSAEVRIAWAGEDMRQWRVLPADGADIAAAPEGPDLRVCSDLPALGWTIFETCPAPRRAADAEEFPAGV